MSDRDFTVIDAPRLLASLADKSVSSFPISSKVPSVQALTFFYSPSYKVTCGSPVAVFESKNRHRAKESKAWFFKKQREKKSERD